MKRNVVFAKKVVLSRAGVVPPALPSAGFTLDLSPLHARGEVAGDGLEPHIDTTVFIARYGHRYAPVDIAGNRPSLEFFIQKLLSLSENVWSPVGTSVYPGSQSVLKLR